MACGSNPFFLELPLNKANTSGNTPVTALPSPFVAELNPPTPLGYRMDAVATLPNDRVNSQWLNNESARGVLHFRLMIAIPGAATVTGNIRIQLQIASANQFRPFTPVFSNSNVSATIPITVLSIMQVIAVPISISDEFLQPGQLVICSWQRILPVGTDLSVPIYALAASVSR